MANLMEQKVQMIDEYIEKLDSAITENNAKAARDLQEEIIAVYDSEIPRLTTKLSNYSIDSFYDKGTVNFVRDAKLLKGKLLNYKINLESELYKPFQKSDGAVMVSQNVDQSVNVSVSVNLQQTIDNIQELSESTLSAEDKERLTGKVATIAAENDKTKRWDKISETLRWIADKGIQVGTAVLPYIVKMLEGNQ